MTEEKTTVDLEWTPVVDGEPDTDNTLTMTVPKESTVELNMAVDGEEVTDGYILPDKVYTILKWLAIFVMPAAGVFVQTLGNIWNVPIMEPIALTITAVNTFVGAVIGISSVKNYLGK